MMPSDKRGRLAWTRHVLGAGFLVAGLSACTSIAGGAALLGAVSIGVLTSRCYDYVDVTVLDADGRKTCAATVTASKDGSQFELPSCYYGALTDGHWTLRARLAGSADAVAHVQVDHAEGCTRYVQSVELTLNRMGAPTQLRALRPMTQVPVQAPSGSPATPPASAAPPPPTQQPSEIPGSAAPSTATPPSSATPPVGVFPDSTPPH